MYARSKLTTSSAAVERGGLAKCCHALRTHQHAQGGRVAARPSGRGNEAASSEPSIYSVRTVERIIGHSLHGQSRGSERGGGLAAFPRGLRPDTFQVESILGVRRSFCILSAPSSTVSLHILSRSLASLSCSRPLVHMPRHMCSPLLYTNQFWRFTRHVKWPFCFTTAPCPHPKSLRGGRRPYSFVR